MQELPRSRAQPGGVDTDQRAAIPADFNPEEHAYTLFLDGRRVPTSIRPHVQVENGNVCIVFVTSPDLLRGTTKEEQIQRAVGDWKTTDTAYVKEHPTLPRGGVVQIESFHLPDREGDPILAVVKIMTHELWSWQPTQRKLGVYGETVTLPLAVLTHPERALT